MTRVNASQILNGDSGIIGARVVDANVAMMLVSATIRKQSEVIKLKDLDKDKLKRVVKF